MFKLFAKAQPQTSKAVLFGGECREGYNGKVVVSGISNQTGRRYTTEVIPFQIVGLLGMPKMTPETLRLIWSEATEQGLTVHECLELVDNPAHAPQGEHAGIVIPSITEIRRNNREYLAEQIAKDEQAKKEAE